MYKYLHFILTAILIAACSSAPTATPNPVTVEDGGIRVQVDEARVFILSVREGSYYARQVVKTRGEAEQDAFAGQYHIANDGTRFVEVTLMALAGADPKEVYEWKLLLKDTQENLYEAVIKSSGIMAGGADNMSWIFVVPNEEEVSAVIFPGDITVDLETLIQEE